MTSGWPQDKQDARWPYSDAYDGAGGRIATDSDRSDRSSGYLGTEHPSAPLPVTREPLGRGRATDSDRGGRSSADFGPEHPSAPLPVTPDPRGRRGRGKSRGGGRSDSGGGDADYEWIHYLGEAGPAQGQSQRPADVPPATSRSRRAKPAKADDRGSRSGGMLPRRHAVPDPAERPRPSYPASPPGLPPHATSQQAYPSADAHTTALPATPARPDEYRTRTDGYRTPAEGYRTPPEGYRTPPEGYRTPPEGYRTQADDSNTWPGRSAVMPERTSRPSSDPLATGRAARQAPPSAAPWPVAPQPAEARLAPPDRAQRPGARRGPDPVGGPATSAFERPTQVTTAPAKPGPVQKRDSDERGVPARKPARRKRRHPVLVGLVGGGLVGAAAAAGILGSGVLNHTGSGPQHRIVTPEKMLAYVQNPSLAKSMGAEALRAEIMAKGSGEASHVVDAVYEDTAGAAAKSTPQILLFVGGNLSGSAGSFISGFTQMLSGAFVIKAGPLGGQAACVPGAGGHPAECVWADNDTFGLVASPALSASTLAGELRSVRPMVELRVK